MNTPSYEIITTNKKTEIFQRIEENINEITLFRNLYVEQNKKILSKQLENYIIGNILLQFKKDFPRLSKKKINKIYIDNRDYKKAVGRKPKYPNQETKLCNYLFDNNLIWSFKNIYNNPDFFPEIIQKSHACKMKNRHKSCTKNLCKAMISSTKIKNPTIIEKILKILSNTQENPNDYESNQSQIFQFSEIENESLNEINEINEFSNNSNLIYSPLILYENEKCLLVFNSDCTFNYINEN